MKMNLNDRVYYTGDMANAGDCGGTIVAVHPANRFSPETYDVLLDQERFEGDKSRMVRMIYGIMFDPQPGRRFWPYAEWEADRKRQIEEMHSRMVRS